ncbi:MAG: PilZ domain-containing protein [Proteobacteria bacterium]|nr:PilZ domain-containing protein [Pseudomonadota bacterium]
MERQKDQDNTKEQRRKPRIETSNFVGYTIFDLDRKTIDQGTGRTINLSQNGLLLKTQKALKGAFVMLMTIDLDGNDVRVEGRLIYSAENPTTGHYLSGVEFTGSKDKQLQAIVTFVKAYQHRKHKKK